ncbi:MAG: NAD-dependent epimerase/dehydratase family protein [Myxococcales bacterium]|nr:NAD-dependent epimerase/dehydratase family protein [Myxococcales bacterium]
MDDEGSESKPPMAGGRRRRVSVRAPAAGGEPASAPPEAAAPSTPVVVEDTESQANTLSRPPSAVVAAPESEAEQEGAVVITGICGRIGRLLARTLHRKGPVIGIDRRKFEDRPEDIVHHQLDLRRRKTRDIFRSGGIRAVVHLGVMHDLRETDRAHHEWNVVGLQKLLEYVTQYGIGKLVVLSSASLYGPSPDNAQFLTEEAPLLGAQEFSQIRDLVEVDMVAQSFFWKNPEVETVILRPCHILGRVKNAPSNYCRMDRPITVMGFDPMMQVIHERDVVEAIDLSLQKGVRGIFNLRGPGELPLSRMLELLGKRPRAVPGPVARGVIGRMWSYRASSYPTPELDHLRYICMVDDSRARRELGFTPSYNMRQTLEAVFSER